MTPVTTVTEVSDAVQRAKTGATTYCTNFFPTQPKLQGWIDHGELAGEFQDRVTFFGRKDRDFWHSYFCAPDVGTLEREVAESSFLRTERVAVDLVGNEAIGLQSGGGLAGELASLWVDGLPPDNIAKESEKIDKSTVADVTTVAYRTQGGKVKQATASAGPASWPRNARRKAARHIRRSPSAPSVHRARRARVGRPVRGRGLSGSPAGE